MEKGFALPKSFMIIIVVFAAVMVLPLFLAEFFPIFKWAMLGFFCISIYIFVRNIIGPGLLSWAMSGVLIYILVVKLWQYFVMGWMLYALGIFGLTGIIIFGLQKHGE